MEILNLIQGTTEWHKERLTSFTASEAPAMMGKSKYMTRTELLELKKTGVQKEVSPQTQKIFDKGHATEAMARPIVEKIYTEEFFPVTGVIEVSGLRILASFDGINMMEDTVFEHKLFNKDLAKFVLNGNLPEHYYWQLEQQMLVSGAERTIFVVSDGTEEGMHSMEYYPVDGRREQLIAGWKQFAIDLESFESVKPEIKHETKAVALLPDLAITINGEVSSSNLAVYQKTATEVISSINTELTLDEHFAQAEVDIKFCTGAEKELEAVKKQALSSTADIDMLFKTIDHLSSELKTKRLTLSKLVKTQKDQIKRDIVNAAFHSSAKYMSKLEHSLSGMKLPDIEVDFTGAIKGKRNLASMRDAVDTELARVKIEINEASNLIRSNLAQYENKAVEHKFLFNDLQQIILNDAVSFSAIVDQRIGLHKQAEEKRLEAEREKIRVQEQQKAEQAERKKQKEDQAQIKAEEAEHQRLLDEHEQVTEHELCCSREFQDDAVTGDIPLPTPPVINPVEVPDVTTAVSTEKMVTITESEYSTLVDDSNLLQALKAAGVDNWVDYNVAQEILEEMAA